MPGKNHASTRYSGLAEITAANAKALRPVWTFSTGVLAGHEGQPLVVKNTMYVVTPYPNVLYAFDLTQEGYPLRWKYRPDVSPNAIGISCCDVINRGAFYADGKIVYNLLDGHTVAVDAATGREVWKTKIADIGRGRDHADGAVRGQGPRHRRRLRRRVRDLRVAEGSRPEDRQDRLDGPQHRPGQRDAGEARAPSSRSTTRAPIWASTSWPKDAWKIGGAPVWGWISYDPDLDLLYYGVGNPAPYNPEQRPGDNKWTLERPGPPAGGRLAGVGLPVHPDTTTGTTTRRRR